MLVEPAAVPEKRSRASIGRRAIAWLGGRAARMRVAMPPRCTACGEPLLTPGEVKDRFCADKRACEEDRMGCYW